MKTLIPVIAAAVFAAWFVPMAKETFVEASVQIAAVEQVITQAGSAARR